MREGSASVIGFSEVSKVYPDGTVAVDRLTLAAGSGEITVLVGPSGCGKTTSLRMVNKMITPSSGTVTIDGRDTASLDATELRRGIGYVIQNGGLFPHRTILDNISTVPLLLGQTRREARGRAMELLETVGLSPTLAQRYPSQLSGGQQQRVGVARALAADPPVMLMDEPFSAVDPVVREQLQDEFLRLQGELGKTILFVTHDIDEAVKLGDRVAVLRVGGQLAQFDTPERLLADPVDDFVADFLGRDRGYRALGFAQAPRLRYVEEPTQIVGQPLDATAFSDQWVLVVDDQRRPLGWRDLGHRLSTNTGLHRGGTVARIDGSLRSLLDAALSSPSGRGVVVDAGGALLGTVTANDVLVEIQRHRGEPAADPRQSP